jgi:hypothetical protein
LTTARRGNGSTALSRAGNHQVGEQIVEIEGTDPDLVGAAAYPFANTRPRSRPVSSTPPGPKGIELLAPVIDSLRR